LFQLSQIKRKDILDKINRGDEDIFVDGAIRGEYYRPGLLGAVQQAQAQSIKRASEGRQAIDYSLINFFYLLTRLLDPVSPIVTVPELSVKGILPDKLIGD
jgi:hypothetical protein